MAKKQDSNKKKISPKKEDKIGPPPATVSFRFLEKHSLFIAGGVLLVMLLVLLCQYVFGDRIFLFKDAGSDTIGQIWPYYDHYSRYFRTDGIPRWTFGQGLGSNAFPAYLGDVVGNILYLVNPANIPYTFVYVQILKLLLAGLFFFLFLRKIGLSHYASLLGAAMYSFSGFMTIGSTWFFFTTEGLYLALLLYGLELLRQDRNLLVFPIAIALVAANNPVFLYLDSILLAAYLGIIFLYKGFQKADLSFLGRAILLGILGLGISTFLVTGYLGQAAESPRGAGLSSYDKTLSAYPAFKPEQTTLYPTFALRMLGNDMTGPCGYGGGDAYKGWVNYLEAPTQYCGLLVLLLLPQLFILAGRKLKILAAVSLGIALFAVIFPYFRYAFWLFSGDYFRTFSLFFDVMSILLALKTLDLIIRQRRINLPLLIGTYLLLVAILFFVKISNDELQPQVLIFLSVEAILVWGISYPPLHRKALIALLPVVFIELIVLSWGTFYSRETLTKSELVRRTGFNDHTVEALDHIRSLDRGFYRIHKDYFSGPVGKVTCFNDALIQNYYSSGSYHQFNNVNYARFLQKTGVIPDTYENGLDPEVFTRFIGGLVNRPMLAELVSSKYMFCKNPLDHAYSIWYDSIASYSDIKVYKNKYPLPLGFTYDSYITENDMAKIEKNHKDFMMLIAGVLDTSRDVSDLKRIEARDTAALDTITTFNLHTLLDHIRHDTLHISLFSQNHIEGDIKTEKKKILFFSIPYSKGWRMKVDGRDVKPLMVNFGFLGYILDAGTHRVELSFEPLYYTASMEVSAVSLLLYSGLVIFVLVARRKKKLAR